MCVHHMRAGWEFLVVHRPDRDARIVNYPAWNEGWDVPLHPVCGAEV